MDHQIANFALISDLPMGTRSSPLAKPRLLFADEAFHSCYGYICNFVTLKKYKRCQPSCDGVGLERQRRELCRDGHRRNRYSHGWEACCCVGWLGQGFQSWGPQFTNSLTVH
eukprot:1157560-Pelagomonas_calceolata.AAC.6